MPRVWRCDGCDTGEHYYVLLECGRVLSVMPGYGHPVEVVPAGDGVPPSIYPEVEWDVFLEELAGAEWGGA